MNSIDRLNKLTANQFVMFLAGGVTYPDYVFRTAMGHYRKPVKSEFDIKQREDIALEIKERAGIEEEGKYRAYCESLTHKEDLHHIHKVNILNYLESNTKCFRQELINDMLTLFKKHSSESTNRINETKRLSQILGLKPDDCVGINLEAKRLELYEYAVEVLRKQLQPLREMPNELKTESAQEILNKAIEYGLCDKDYKWLKTKRLLAYFAAKASNHLKLNNAQYNGKTKICWKPFEVLFNMTGLAISDRDMKNDGNPPVEYELVNNIFPDETDE